jgi:LuxR family quorum sensing-dependent transcriptional regulator
MSRDAVESGLAFIERCATERDIRALVAEFQARIRDFGFTHAVCGGWVGLAKSRIYRFFFNEWPQDWLDLYMKRGFMPDDPFVLEVRRRMTPYSLRDVEGMRLTARGREVIEAVYAYGWRDAIGFPIHGPAGYQGLVSLATTQTVSLPSRHIAVLHLMAISVHDRCRAAIDFGMPTQRLPQLSAREIECMQWVAVGKTDADIAQLLGISAATAHYHVEQAKKKLGKSSRTEAVALLVLHGLI